MNNLIPLIVAALFYRIKLIDERKTDNFMKFKNYLKREEDFGKSSLYESDEWLEKDIPFQFMERYLKFKKDDGKRRAVLDYYKDYKDNERTRVFLIWMIMINVVYFSFLKHPYFLLDEILLLVLTVFSIYICFKQPVESIINNPVLNESNSEKVKKIYEETQQKIEKNIIKYKSKYKVK